MVQKFRTLYSEKDYYVMPFDWSPDGKYIVGIRNKNEINELTLISTADGTVRVSEEYSFTIIYV